MELRLRRDRRRAPERGAPGPFPRRERLRAGRRPDRRLPRVLRRGAGAAAGRPRPGVAGEGAAPQTGGARTMTLSRAARQTLVEGHARQIEANVAAWRAWRREGDRGDTTRSGSELRSARARELCAPEPEPADRGDIDRSRPRSGGDHPAIP